ncbi:Ig-like domain (group 3) [Granulicella rosea]|uniref:Ig-like domain (Group 3) n=1 Tax=Granulicella rosea TaxID=474952 RepID=A0A239H9E3_9BACT|nr:Ig-like domain repeat protein [Granulicella rosea]SNS76874.1 Ig-like domain (group 3) [Granulicella rosea]
MNTKMLVVRRAALSVHVAVAALVLLAGAVFTPARAFAERMTLTTSATRTLALSNLTDAGAVPASQPVHVTLALKPDATRTAALDATLSALIDPTSTSYHKWLTPAQFAASYGASDAQIAAATAWATAQGLTVDSVSAGKTQIAVSGSAAQIQSAFAVSLHVFQTSSSLYYANTSDPSLTSDAAALFSSVAGLDNLPSGVKFNVAAQGQTATAATTTAGAIADTLALVDANTATILTVDSALCSSALVQSQIDQYRTLLRQASAQGITVLATSGCGAQGTGSFPASLPEATAILAAGSLASTAMLPIEARPNWQSAPGLPADSLRYEPDLTASSLTAFAQTIASIVQTSGRQGNINANLYKLAPTAGLYTQADGATDTWEAASGLGTIDLATLAKAYPRGAGASFTSFGATNYAPVHGQNTTFTSTVTSGTGGATPSGTVSFVTSTGTNLGTVALINGTGSLTINTLAGGTYTIGAQYSGDATYIASSSPTSTILIQPEPATLSATIAGAATIGGTLSVVVVDTAASGVGLPTGVVTASLPSNGSTYSATLSPATTHSSSATITIPATTVGTITLSINCTTSADFSCYNPYTTTFTVAKATPLLSISYSPSPVVSGAQVTLNANVTAVGTAPVPTGNVRFFDNGTVLNAGALSNGATSTTGLIPSTATHQITATYDGDANYNTVSTTGNSTTSGPIATTTTLTASATTVVANQVITFTATVNPASTGSTAPTGQVQFYDGAVLLGTASLNGTSASYQNSQLSASSAHSITAYYVGDQNYNASTSNAVALSRSTTPVATTTTLSSSASQVVLGQTITFTATIAPTTQTTGAPAATGTVQFYDGTTSIGSATVNNNVALLSTSLLTNTVNHSITAVYLGDGNYAGSTSQIVVVNKGSGLTATSVQLTLSATTAVAGTAVVLTAAVGPTVNSTPPSGTVNFLVGGSTICSAVLTAGSTSCSVTTLPSGSDIITASYLGDTNYSASVSGASTITVTGSTSTGTAKTTTTLTANPTTSSLGAPITLTAAVVPTSGATTPVVTGTVQFIAPTTGATVCTAAVASGIATCSVTTFTLGTNSVQATYLGDVNYASSTSSAISVTISATSTTTASLIAQFVPNVPVLPGATSTITASVVAPTGTIPAGTVTATITGGNGTVFSSAAIATTTSVGTVYIPVVAPTTVGSYTVVVACATTNVTCATTVSLPLVVSATAKIGTATVLTATASTTTTGAYTLSSVTTAQSTGSAALSGSVAFYDGTTLLGSGTISNGAATFTGALVTGTSHSLTAVYSGDTIYASSTSPIVTVGSGAGTTVATITLTSNVQTSVSGLNVVLTAQVSGTATTTAGAVVATGKVSFYDTFGGVTTLIGTSTLTASGVSIATASVSTTGLKAGTHVIYAVYAGDTNFASATSNSLTLAETDYNAIFTPATLTLAQGTTGTVVVNTSAIGGYTGNVSFTCIPPVGASIGCSFSSPTVGIGSSTILTIATVKSSAQVSEHAANTGGRGWNLAAGIACALVFCGLFPRRRRILPTLLLALVAAGLVGTVGCVNGTFPQSPNTTGGTTTGGTPIGTAVLTINSVGSDGTNEVAHTYYYQVTVQ